MRSVKALFLCVYLILNVATKNVIAQDDQTSCADGTECQNGSTCIPLELGYRAPNSKSPNGIRTYRCDCSKTTGTHIYAGYECIYTADDFCLYGVHAVDPSVSFCANNGRCIETTSPDNYENSEHMGCDCQDGFDGDFCQYLQGEAPIKVSQSTGPSVMITVSFTVISIVCVGLFVIVGTDFIRRRKAKKEAKARMLEMPGSQKVEDIENTIDIHHAEYT